MRSTWGWDEVRLPAPVFEGDTIYAQSEVLNLRPSKSRPHQGIVGVRTVGFNQEGVVVIEFKRTLLVYRRGHGPRPARPPVQKVVSGPERGRPDVASVQGVNPQNSPITGKPFRAVNDAPRH